MSDQSDFEKEKDKRQKDPRRTTKHKGRVRLCVLMETKIDISTLIPLGKVCDLFFRILSQFFKVEDLLSIIVERLNRHEETLTHLSQTMNTLLTKDSAERYAVEQYTVIATHSTYKLLIYAMSQVF